MPAAAPQVQSDATERVADKGLRALLDGDIQRAEFFCRDALAQNDGDIAAAIGVGLCKAGTGEFREGFETILTPIQRLITEVKGLTARVVELDGLNERERRHHDAIYDELYEADFLARRPFYNIGPGHFVHPHWTNVDKYSEAYPAGAYQVDIEFDLLDRTPLAVDHGAAEAVYCSHVINLIREEDAAFLFSEMRRILKPGGVFRVTGINSELLYRAYLSGDKALFQGLGSPNDSLAELFVGHVAGHRLPGGEPNAVELHAEELGELARTLPMEEFLDTCCSEIDIDYMRRRPCSNVTWWNFDKLQRFLLDAGFRNVERSGMGQSKCPLMRDLTLFDRTSLDKITLYTDATV